ncbi:MAG: hypothetical protein HY554_04505 [Elusimicrobia bacterium]|nr:hypothetical protein [Elusimicrobiota bacterium]
MARTVYLYVDEAGVAHAVGDAKAVPRRFRQKAKALSVPDQPALQWRAPELPAAGPLLQWLVPMIAGYLLWRWITGFLGRLALALTAAFLAYSLVFDRLFPRELLTGGLAGALPKAGAAAGPSEIDLRSLGLDPKLLDELKEQVRRPKAGDE